MHSSGISLERVANANHVHFFIPNGVSIEDLFKEILTLEAIQ